MVRENPMPHQVINSEVDLALRGYTLSFDKIASLGRVGSEYVMRDSSGHRESLPVETSAKELAKVWAAFRSHAAEARRQAVRPEKPAPIAPRWAQAGQGRPSAVPAGWLERFIASGNPALRTGHMRLAAESPVGTARLHPF